MSRYHIEGNVFFLHRKTYNPEKCPKSVIPFWRATFTGNLLTAEDSKMQILIFQIFTNFNHLTEHKQLISTIYIIYTGLSSDGAFLLLIEVK